MSKEVAFYDQDDGSTIKEVYDSASGKHDLYGPDGDSDPHGHVVTYDSAISSTDDPNVDEATADFVRDEKGDVLFDSGFFGPSEDREEFFHHWK